MTALKDSQNVFPISVYDWNSLEKVKEILNKIKSEKIISFFVFLTLLRSLSVKRIFRMRMLYA